MTSSEAARRLAQSSAWVYQWRRRWADEGFRLDDLPRSGRPRIYSALDRAKVIAVACELPSQRDLPLSRLHSGAYGVVADYASTPALSPRTGRSSLTSPTRDRNALLTPSPSTRWLPE
jgi:transposase